MSLTFEIKPVLFGVERVGARGVGVVRLNRPEALNSLNTKCYQLIEEKFSSWSKDDEIAAIMILGSGDKAFCAGGDVKTLVIEGRTQGPRVANDFFTLEYFIDHWVHHFNKPILALMDGITMGGGLGLAIGASHRVVTERSMIAMPEISIGLHPDVGASLFLPKLAGGFGRFMGLTGARVSGVDAVAVGLADFAIDSSQIRKLLVDVLRLPWSGQAQKDRDLLSGFLNYVSKSSKVVSGVAPKTVWIEKTKEIFSDLRDLRQFDQGLRSLSGLADANDQKWWSETFARYEAGSWWAKAVFLAATVRHQDLTISQTLEREWEMSMSACVGTEFPEGVRSVLIDKDHRPRWSYATLSEFEAANPNLEEYFRYSKSVNLTNGFAEKCAKHNI